MLRRMSGAVKESRAVNKRANNQPHKASAMGHSPISFVGQRPWWTLFARQLSTHSRVQIPQRRTIGQHCTSKVMRYIGETANWDHEELKNPSPLSEYTDWFRNYAADNGMSQRMKKHENLPMGCYVVPS